MLDFDFEKLCSVSLSRINVYACLVCGKYFQGRGPNTHAYTHSVSDGHRVYLNLQTLRFYCLPDNYEIIDSSLNDIIFVVNPTFSREYILHKVNQSKMSRAYDGTLYLPGIVGLNNIKANDYCNVVLQALSNITPLRNYFLDPSNYSHIHHAPGTQGLAMFPLITRFGELVRKLWNPRNFKAHVSPHEMLQFSAVFKLSVYCKMNHSEEPLFFFVGDDVKHPHPKNPTKIEEGLGRVEKALTCKCKLQGLWLLTSRTVQKY
ncbi:ubiquitin carboxyl-terminal hydrolase 39-like [Macrobrachium nipponense]|uniref:ubiquitin carboxyl-terminal hydrolase 39-like n=1 Tax=Macrobrachium nipponense TaxID=159736 RepID=UPI0030C7BA0F